MSESYPRRDQARGIWKIGDITKNIKGDGTYPGSIGGDRAIFFGGWAPGGGNNIIDFVEVTTTGNATDFGDMTSARYGGSAFSDGVRAGMYVATSPVTAIDYVHVSTTGNAADFGDATVARLYSFGASTKTKGYSAGGRTPSLSDVIEFVTVASVGNGTDFGDLHAGQEKAGSGNNHVRALYGGGAAPSNTNAIGFYELTSSGNSVDFGDLTRSESYMSGSSSNTKVVFGGGSPGVNTMDEVTIGHLGNAIDFGDLTVAREAASGTGNMRRGLFAGGYASDSSNVIDYITFSTRANAIDFGDLTVARGYGDFATSQSNSGIEEFNPRAPELYSPTGKVVPRGGGAGQIGLIVGGEDGPGNNLTSVEFLIISTLGNSQDFGNMDVGSRDHAVVSSSTRLLKGGSSSPALSNAIGSIEFSTKGNGADFGDLTEARRNPGGFSNTTRGLFAGGSGTPGSNTMKNIIDYVTIASFGNATDFGDLTSARRCSNSGAGSSTRALFSGGTTPGTSDYVNTIDYVTTGSTGNATDFGDLTVARSYGSALSSSTRAVYCAGQSPSASNVIDYVTTASTGNATDFGDSTVARANMARLSNSTRGVFASGYVSPGMQNVIDYITIGSTGNAIDFGDVVTARSTDGQSNGHGGLS